MEHPLSSHLRRLTASVLGEDGALALGLRRAAHGRGELPAVLQGFVEKLRSAAYRITDEDLSVLRDAGYSEDQLYELITATALGEGQRRLDHGLRALRGG